MDRHGQTQTHKDKSTDGQRGIETERQGAREREGQHKDIGRQIDRHAEEMDKRSGQRGGTDTHNA